MRIITTMVSLSNHAADRLSVRSGKIGLLSDCVVPEIELGCYAKLDIIYIHKLLSGSFIQCG